MSNPFRIPFATALAGGAVLLLAAGAASQQPAEEEGPDVPFVGLEETAAELARSGIAHGDPRSVLAAAQIMITAERPAPGLERTGATAGAGPEAPPMVEEVEKRSLTARGLLREAVRLAVEQRDAATAQAAVALAADAEAGLGDQALADELRQEAEALGRARGAIGGPVWAENYLYPEHWTQYDITFQGGYVPNWVNVYAGNGYADLDCYLYDHGRLVAQDTRYVRNCGMSWNQAWTGTMSIVIWNRGAATGFRLQSN